MSSTRSATANKMDRNRLSPDGKLLYDYIQSEFSSMKNHFTEIINMKDKELKDMTKRFTDAITAKNEEVSALQAKVVQLEKNSREDSRKYEQALDDANQYERKDSLILSGPALPDANPSENTHEIVKNLLETNFNIRIEPHDICITHRLQPLKAGPNKKNIYVKFVRRDRKKEVIQKSRETRQAKQLFANESLTPVRMKMFRILRNMKKRVPTVVKGCTTLDGKVFAFTPPAAGGARDQRHFIRDRTDLHDFCRDYVKEQLDIFLDAAESA